MIEEGNAFYSDGSGIKHGEELVEILLTRRGNTTTSVEKGIFICNVVEKEEERGRECVNRITFTSLNALNGM